MLGYWGDETKTKEVIDKDGWIHSGDVGILDDEGYMHIVGRVKDIIIRGGENIYPKEIENHLMTHENIFDVQVVGVKDENMGEEVVACMILKDPHLGFTKTEMVNF
jgi:fatty-acyl-CoA synthase